jgi:hypothetical protein
VGPLTAHIDVKRLSRNLFPTLSCAWQQILTRVICADACKVKAKRCNSGVSGVLRVNACQGHEMIVLHSMLTVPVSFRNVRRNPWPWGSDLFGFLPIVVVSFLCFGW